MDCYTGVKNQTYPQSKRHPSQGQNLQNYRNTNYQLISYEILAELAIKANLPNLPNFPAKLG